MYTRIPTVAVIQTYYVFRHQQQVDRFAHKHCYKHFNNFASIAAEALLNCHGRTVVDFLIDYWIVSKSMRKLYPEVRHQMLYLVLNSMSEYNHLLIKQVLNAMFSCILI